MFGLRSLFDQRLRTPTVIQMEAVECGAAALGTILGYYGKFVPLEALRVACGVSRDGSKANNVLKAARNYGLVAEATREDPASIQKIKLPVIVFWNFNHFLVVEGFNPRKGRVYLNDPATGPRTVTFDEFDKAFTGVTLSFEPGDSFRPGGTRHGALPALANRLGGSKPALIYIMLVSLLLLIPGLVLPTFTRIFIDDVLVSGHDWIPALLIGLGTTAILMALLTYLQRRFLLLLETRLALLWSARFFWHLFRLPMNFFSQRYAGELGTRVTTNDTLAVFLSSDLATNGINLLLIVFYGVLMLQYDIPLTLIGLAIAGLNLLALQLIARRRTDTNQRLLLERGKLTGVSMQGLQLIETLKAGGLESDFFAQWGGQLAKTTNAEQELGFSSELLSAAPVFLTFANTALILLIGGLRVMDGYLTLGMLVAFQTLMTSFMAPITGLVNLGGKFQETIGDMKRLDDVMRYEEDQQYSQQTQDLNRTAIKLDGYVELKNVTFGYSQLEPPLIVDFNLSLKPGMRVALVGGSGSGKSTVAKLVTGLYPVWSGEILFDGKPVNELPRNVVHNSVAMVDQDIFLFEGTIRENLTLWDKSIDEATLVRATKDAAVHDVVAARTGGYDHFIEEGGRNFSGGQRQRLEIARALMTDPSILVMDEATSALDPVTEKQIDENLRRRGCTCLIIAHRLSTIRDADEIIVLENGKVVQRGTHHDLYQMGGAYARLISASEQQVEKPRIKSLLERLMT
jgi:NHLM bacteriocin system ABC transporter peptidase/ATP-binding protein